MNPIVGNESCCLFLSRPGCCLTACSSPRFLTRTNDSPAPSSRTVRRLSDPDSGATSIWLHPYRPGFASAPAAAIRGRQSPPRPGPPKLQPLTGLAQGPWTGSPALRYSIDPPMNLFAIGMLAANRDPRENSTTLTLAQITATHCIMTPPDSF